MKSTAVNKSCPLNYFEIPLKKSCEKIFEFKYKAVKHISW